jgi:hypothetical protein
MNYTANPDHLEVERLHIVEFNSRQNNPGIGLITYYGILVKWRDFFINPYIRI